MNQKDNFIIFLFIVFTRYDFDWEKHMNLDLNPDFNVSQNQMYSGSPYPFGLDPVIMALKKNYYRTITYSFNSLKRYGIWRRIKSHLQIL